MTLTGLALHSPDEIKRRVMFALELVDPVTGRLVSEGMVVTAAGLARPVVAPSGRFVWIDIDPPAVRQVKVEAVSKRRTFAPFAADFQVPARLPGVVAQDLVRRFDLQPTGLYEPPPGMLAAAGMLVVSDGDRTGLPDVEVRLQFRDASNGALLPGDYLAKTDLRGMFVTVARDLGPTGPMTPPPPAPFGSLVGWLSFTRPDGQVGHTPLLPLRKGRLFRLPEPVAWGSLLNNPPPAPP